MGEQEIKLFFPAFFLASFFFSFTVFLSYSLSISTFSNSTLLLLEMLYHSASNLCQSIKLDGYSISITLSAMFHVLYCWVLLGSVHTRIWCGKFMFHACFPHFIQNAMQLQPAVAVNEWVEIRTSPGPHMNHIAHYFVIHGVNQAHSHQMQGDAFLTALQLH